MDGTKAGMENMLPTNLLLILFITVYGSAMLFDLFLEILNTNHLRRLATRVPASFQGIIDAAKLRKMSEYEIHHSRLGILREATSDLALLFMIISGSLTVLAGLVSRLTTSSLLAGLLFFFVPALILFVTDLPFNYYTTFVLEERFGFNCSTRRIWIVDQLKSAVLTVTISAVLLLAVLGMIERYPRSWWLFGFMIVSAVQILLVVLYPVAIAPLFNKLLPISDENLAEKIRKLMSENDMRVKKISEMNASLRSRHTNAYIAGLGKTKQIVLFDSLIASHPSEEILAILAHEVGHYKKKHTLKQLLLFEVGMSVLFYLTYLLVQWPLLYSSFGFEMTKPYFGLFLAGVFWQKLGFFLKPIPMAIARHFEREADLFACELLSTCQPLASSLKRMASDNLANLFPHPLYVVFNYSHPPTAERVAYLQRAWLQNRVTAGNQEALS